MSGKEMVPWGTAIVGEVLSALQIPGGGFFGTDSGTDPFIEIIYRFSKAAADGAARDNLRLLAQVIAGLKKNKALEPDKFRKWANTLEQLTRDELIVIGKSIALRRALGPDGTHLTPGEFWKQLRATLETSGYQPNEIEPLCASLGRTGLLLSASAYGGMIYLPTPWLDELEPLADVEGITAAKGAA
jgi:hypothetical protein